jgi:hypothetical protein
VRELNLGEPHLMLLVACFTDIISRSVITVKTSPKKHPYPKAVLSKDHICVAQNAFKGVFKNFSKNNPTQKPYLQKNILFVWHRMRLTVFSKTSPKTPLPKSHTFRRPYLCGTMRLRVFSNTPPKPPLPKSHTFKGLYLCGTECV